MALHKSAKFVKVFSLESFPLYMYMYMVLKCAKNGLDRDVQNQKIFLGEHPPPIPPRLWYTLDVPYYPKNKPLPL